MVGDLPVMGVELRRTRENGRAVKARRGRVNARRPSAREAPPSRRRDKGPMTSLSTWVLSPTSQMAHGQRQASVRRASTRAGVTIDVNLSSQNGGRRQYPSRRARVAKVLGIGETVSSDSETDELATLAGILVSRSTGPPVHPSSRPPVHPSTRRPADWRMAAHASTCVRVS
jgi:hypothetical protein